LLRKFLAFRCLPIRRRNDFQGSCYVESDVRNRIVGKAKKRVDYLFVDNIDI